MKCRKMLVLAVTLLLSSVVVVPSFKTYADLRQYCVRIYFNDVDGVVAWWQCEITARDREGAEKVARFNYKNGGHNQPIESIDVISSYSLCDCGVSSYGKVDFR